MTPNLDDYVDVAERIRQFYEKHPDGRLVSGPGQHFQIGDRHFVGIQAKAYRTPDDPLPGVGTAWEPVPGPTPFTKDSELMNAETAAWGRAIVALGFETKKIASQQEMQARQEEKDSVKQEEKPSPAQHAMLAALLKDLEERAPKAEDDPTYIQDAQLYVKSRWGKQSRSQLTKSEMSILIDVVQTWVDAIDVPFGEEVPNSASVS